MQESIIEVDSLEDALLKCRRAARNGYKIAKSNLNDTSEAIKKASKTLSECMMTHESGVVRDSDIVEQLKKQLAGVVNELHELQDSMEIGLEEKKQRLDLFSITLFGRTMAGKSTLMEILTKGNGEAIGLGAQRTTRDVREYKWNGLEVTDVPGVAAFDGEVDEELAFKAAEQADLVLFLVTDDAPQPAEAECLARIRRLGKPIIGICNVKAAVDSEDDLRLFLRNPDRSFDRIRLNELLDQFHDFSDQHLPGKRIQFVTTHLRSRFIANLPMYAKHREKLLQASRFDIVEAHIIKQVIGRGTFLRIKSFLDGAIAPLMELTNILLDFSAQNSASGRVMIEKRRQFQNWSQSFKADGENRINTLISKLMDKLREDVHDFTEDHYDNRYAGQKWDDHVKSLGINEKIKHLQTKLMDECKKSLSEVARELHNELKFVAQFSVDRNITMDPIVDSKRWWNWGVTGVSGGLSIAAIIIGSGPLGWAAAGVGILGWALSWFFEDREKKVRRGREKLAQKLLENIDKLENQIRQQLNEWFTKELLGKQVYVLLKDLGSVTSSLFELADAQRALAWTLNDRKKALDRSLIEETLKNSNVKGNGQLILDIARVPGCATMFLIGEGTKFPEKIKKDLEILLDESIWFVVDNGNSKSLLSQAIGRGCDRNKIRIEEKLKIAHVPINDLDMFTLTRVKLAQQLTGLHVMQ